MLLRTLLILLVLQLKIVAVVSQNLTLRRGNSSMPREYYQQLKWHPTGDKFFLKHDLNPSRFFFQSSQKMSFQFLANGKDNCFSIAVFTEYTNFRETKSLCVQAPSKSAVFTPEQVVRLNNRLYLIYSLLNKKANEKQFIAQELDEAFSLTGKPLEIFVMRGFNNLSKSVVTTSPGGKALMIVRGIFTEAGAVDYPNAFEQMSVAVFDDELKTLWEENFDYSDKGRREVEEAGIDDEGNFYALIGMRIDPSSANSAERMKSPTVLMYEWKLKNLKLEKTASPSEENYGAKMVVGASSAYIVGIASLMGVKVFVQEAAAGNIQRKETFLLPIEKFAYDALTVEHLLLTKNGELVFSIGTPVSKGYMNSGDTKWLAGPSLLASWKDKLIWQHVIDKQMETPFQNLTRAVLFESPGSIFFIHNDDTENASSAKENRKLYRGTNSVIVANKVDRSGALSRHVVSVSDERLAIRSPFLTVDGKTMLVYAGHDVFVPALLSFE
jgi:hypothetical protein